MAFSILSVVTTYPRALFRFPYGRVDGLSHFERNRACPLLFFAFQNLGRPHHLFSAVGERSAPMRAERLSRARYLLFQLLFVQCVEGLQDVGGRRIDR